MCVGSILDVCWAYVACILEVYCMYFENTIDVYWQNSCCVLAVYFNDNGPKLMCMLNVHLIYVRCILGKYYIKSVTKKTKYIPIHHQLINNVIMNRL